MPYIPGRGHTLLIPSGTSNDPDKKHLFVIVTECSQDGGHLLVNFSTIREGVYFDPACIVEPGEHPFITVRSYIEYRLARRDMAIHLQRCVDGWLFQKKDDCDQALLNKISAGVAQSIHISKSMRAYYESVVNSKN